jgi:hypothetical protein
LHIFLQIKVLALQIGMIWVLLSHFTSLKLDLNIAIYLFFSFNFSVILRPRKLFLLLHFFHKNKVLAILNPTSSNNHRNSRVKFSVHGHFFYVFQNACLHLFNISGFVIFKYLCENAWHPMTVYACGLIKAKTSFF